jgi:flagellar hook-associated protein 2
MTSATSSATSSVTSSIVQTLGGGSGIDMAALAQNLATAQFAARVDRLNSKSDTLDKQISTASDLKSQLLQLSTALGTRIRQGDLSAQPVVANSGVATASIALGGNPSGTYSLEVLSLAGSQTLSGPSFASATDPAGSGTLTLRFGTISGSTFTQDTNHAAVSVNIAAGATLSDVAGAINASGAGVSAYVATTASGAQLMLKGQDGAANGFVLDATGDATLQSLAWSPASGNTRLLASATDAHYRLDGLDRTSPTNTINEPAPGFDLMLRSTNIGAPTQISFNDPTTAITTFMSDFADALNSIVGALNQATAPGAGDLASDPGARALRESLARLAGTVIMPNAATGAPRTLADLGLATQRDGTYKFDSARLAATLKSDPVSARGMFTTGLYGVYATMDSLTRNATTSTDPGSLGGSITRYTAQKTSVTSDLADIASKQEELRANLVQRFARTDVNVSASKATLSFLQNQIAAWNGQKN